MGEFVRTSPIDRDIEQAIVALKKGAHLLKYGRRGKPKFCPFRLSADERSLIWFSGKEEKQLRLSLVSKIIPGQRTTNFQRQPRPEKEYQSFSLIYKNGERTLDLICKDKEQAEIWFVGLKALISGAKFKSFYTDERRDGGFLSNTSSPASFVRRNQPVFPIDGEKLTQSSSRNDARPLRMHSLYGTPPSHVTDNYHAEPRYTAEPQKFSDAYSLDNSFYSFSRSTGSEFLKGTNKENNYEEFRMSLSSAISSSSQGSFLDDSNVLGDVLMWGKGVGDGILGGGTGKSSPAQMQKDALLPKTVQSTVMLDVQSVACGAKHAALVTRHGEVFCWGEESGGRLGHRVDADVSQPRLVDTLANMSIEMVACGEYHTCALTRSGDLYSWGDGSKCAGLLGHGSSRIQWFPRRVAGPLDGIRISKVACGDWHTAIITSSGQLFTFGDGTFGALGHGDTKGVLCPKLVESLNSFRSITVACGPWHTAAIVEVLPDHRSKSNASGKLFTWGDGDKGRLGHGDKEKKLVPMCVTALANCDFVQVACGQTLTVALTISGQVFTMGSSTHGQLGNPLADGKANVLVQGSLQRECVEEISAGSFHVAVLTSKGEVYTWGRGANGRLGHGDVEDRNVPTLVEALRDRQVKRVSCGSSFTAVICLHKPISGEDQSCCTGCKMSFTFTRKRHNCYNCGSVFCHACSSKKATRAALAPNRSKPYRVCDPCFVHLMKATDSGPSAGISKSRNASYLIPQTLNLKDKAERADLKFLKPQFFSPKLMGVEQLERYDGDSLLKHNMKLQSTPTRLPERWGQVLCPEYFLSGIREYNFNMSTQSSVPMNSLISRGQSPYRMKEWHPAAPSLSPSKGYFDELKLSSQNLGEELQRLREQVKELERECEKKDAGLRQYENEIREAWAVAREETDQCNAAKDVIKVLTMQLKELAEKVPRKMQSGNGTTAHFQGPLNGLNELLCPITPGLVEVAEVDNTKLSCDNLNLTSMTRPLKDIRVNGSCSPPLSHDTPMSAPVRGFLHENMSRTASSMQSTFVKSGEKHGRAEKLEIERSPYTEWVEQDEPGVYITFMALEGGGKDLKRVRFSRKRFSERQAEQWWAENRLRVYQKYNVEGFARAATGTPR